MIWSVLKVSLTQLVQEITAN